MNAAMGRGTITISYIVLALGAAIAIFPLAMTVINSLKTTPEIFANPFALPASPQWQNFTSAWTDVGLGQAMLNSAIVTATTVILICTTGSMAAYALARKKVRWWKLASIYVLGTTTLPHQLFIFPLYFAYAKLGLINNLFAVSFIYAAFYSPFAIFLLRTYFLAIPVEIEDAARVDGAGAWTSFWRVSLPIASPGILTVAVITGINTWNELLIASTFLQSRPFHTVVVRFNSMSGQYSSDWGQIIAAAILIVLPCVALFLVAQRRFIEGVASGSVKG